MIRTEQSLHYLQDLLAERLGLIKLAATPVDLGQIFKRQLNRGSLNLKSTLTSSESAAIDMACNSNNVLDGNLQTAALHALKLDGARCREFALTKSWRKCAEQFYQNLHRIA